MPPLDPLKKKRKSRRSPIKGRGWTKVKTTAFRRGRSISPGHSISPPKCSDAEMAGQEAMDISNLESTHTIPYNLRSASRTKSDRDRLEEELKEMIVVQLSCVNALLKTALKKHSEASPACKGRHLQFFDVVKVGFGRKARLRCNTCKFESERGKLYQVVRTGKRGPGSALPNTSMPAAVLQSPIGFQTARHLFLAAGMNPLSRTLMQAHGNRGADRICQTVKKQLAKVIQQASQTGPIDVAHDTTYNNRLISHHKPGQGGTQATSTTMDLRSRKILHVDTASKLCPHRGKCGGQCGMANVAEETPMGREEDYARRAAQELSNAGLDIASFTSDGDSTAFRGFQAVFPDIIKYKDTIHLNRAMVRQCLKEKFECAQLRNKAQRKLFACDLSERVNGEFFYASKVLENDKAGMRRTLQFSAAAIVDCYRNVHHLCDRHSFVCSREDRWPKVYLPDNMRQMTLGPEDSQKLKTIIFQRLGVQAVDQTYRAFTTQGVEAFNKALTKTCPKSLTCSRNYKARVMASVERHNSSLMESSQTLFQAATGERMASTVVRALEREQKEVNYNKYYKSQPKSKRRRRELKQERFRKHQCFQDAGGEEGQYEKQINNMQ